MTAIVIVTIIVVGALNVTRWAFKYSAKIQEKKPPTNEIVCPACGRRQIADPSGPCMHCSSKLSGDPGSVNITCLRCGHPKDSHSNYGGGCYCLKFVPNTSGEGGPGGGGGRVIVAPSYTESVLTGLRGPTGVPGGFPSDEAQTRYIALVHAADNLETSARSYYRSGDMACAYSEVGQARVLRDAARRLRDREETVWASDALLPKEPFKSREEELDKSVEEARRATKKDHG